MKMTGRLIAAARALAGVGQADFAKVAEIPTETIALMEANGSAWLHSARDAEAVGRALDKFGIVVIDEGDGMGVGVRLKFTRQDVKQIARLEGEGGSSVPTTPHNIEGREVSGSSPHYRIIRY